MSRRILHVDMDAFFAEVELKRHPELRGKALVIGGRGDPTERGVVSTASYEARKFGVHSAMPLRTALRLCPDAVFLSVDFEAYQRESSIIKGLLQAVAPCMEDVGIDEAFLEISDLPEASLTIAETIKSRIYAATGLRCSIGIAPNKLLAKIASDLDKPDGLTLLREQDIPAKIWPLTVRRLPGVGPKTEQHLRDLAIETVGDLAEAPLSLLIEHFGQAQGEYLHRAAQGIDDNSLSTHWQPKSSSREVTFQRDTADRELLVDTLRALIHEALAHLRAEEFRCRTVAVKIRFSDFETHTRELTLAGPTDREPDIEQAARNCFERIPLDKRVRLIGIRLGDLCKEGGI